MAVLPPQESIRAATLSRHMPGEGSGSVDLQLPLPIWNVGGFEEVKILVVGNKRRSK